MENNKIIKGKEKSVFFVGMQYLFTEKKERERRGSKI